MTLVNVTNDLWEYIYDFDHVVRCGMKIVQRGVRINH
jgi:hypothetical protein